MLYDPSKLLLIAGPCSLENTSVTMQVAETLSEIASEYPDLNLIFKGSFDKANRSLNGDRGPGIEEGLKLLQHVKEEFGFPVLTDIHVPDQAAIVAEVCDVLQIPAFLCRQSDLLEAAAETGRVVNVKKGQFLSPKELGFVAKKLEQFQAAEFFLTERGTFFGYHQLVVDMRGVDQVLGFGHPVILDATHSVLSPGGGTGASSGDREGVLPLIKAGIAVGVHGLFLETHPNPAQAISDKDTQIPLADFPRMIQTSARLWRKIKEL